MGNVNFVRGIRNVRAAYPLGFSPDGVATSTTAVIMGAGTSTTYPEVDSMTGACFLEWHLKTTNTGSGEVYGNYLSLQSAGTGTGYVYAYGALAKSVSGGYVAELAACYFKSQLSAGTVTGQNYVGFFEYIVDTGVANMPSGGVVQLVDIVNGTLNAVHGYITLRTYGTTPFSNLLNIMDHTVGTASTTVLMSSSAAKTHSHSLKIRVGSTAYWIMCTSTGPT